MNPSIYWLLMRVFQIVISPPPPSVEMLTETGIDMLLEDDTGYMITE